MKILKALLILDRICLVINASCLVWAIARRLSIVTIISCVTWFVVVLISNIMVSIDYQEIKACNETTIPTQNKR